MDSSSSSSSSSVGFPLSGNSRSPGNSSPLHSSSVGIPRSETPAPSLHSPSYPVGIPLSENPQFTEIPTNRQLSYNEPPGIMITDEQWNYELANLSRYEDFTRFMVEGNCEDTFMAWYMCMHQVLCHDRNWDDCTELAGAVRNCINGNLNQYQPLLTYFSQRSRHQ